MAEIEINCTTKFKLREAKISKQIKGDEKLSVVIFGDSNFTFSVALAALRGGWDGITAIRFERDDLPPFDFDEVKLLNIEYAIQNGQAQEQEDYEILEKVKKISDLKGKKESPDVKKSVVWLQCPWKSMSDDAHATYNLIKSFIKCMSDEQSNGDFLMIGIAITFPHVMCYHLDKLLNRADGDYLVGRVEWTGGIYYEFLGYDNEIIKEVLHHGYKHQTAMGDIHSAILHDHITLVFQKGSSHDNDCPRNK